MDHPSSSSTASPRPSLRLGTRGSALARWQADWVASQLESRGVRVELVLITTQGDVTTGSLGQAGGVGLFTKEIQKALLDQRIDLAVHSLKDLPTEPIDGLALTAVPVRESVNDVLIAPSAKSLDELPRGARIGTGSTRRRSQLLHLRPDLKILDIRGNVDTRLRKLDDGEYDAIVLAEAGLNRLGLIDRIAARIGPPLLLPAVGQGALGIETRAEDAATKQAVQLLDDPRTHACVVAERAMLRRLRGGCLAPVGAWGRAPADRLLLDGVVLSGNGEYRVAVQVDGTLESAESLGSDAADRLLAQGAADWIAQARE